MNDHYTCDARSTSRRAVAAALLLCLTACASTKAPSEGHARDCRALSAERQATQARRQEAAEDQHGAWKAVIPFAVAARYASAKSKLSAADRHLKEINAAAARQGCGDAAL